MCNPGPAELLALLGAQRINGILAEPCAGVESLHAKATCRTEGGVAALGIACFAAVAALCVCTQGVALHEPDKGGPSRRPLLASPAGMRPRRVPGGGRRRRPLVQS